MQFESRNTFTIAGTDERPGRAVVTDGHHDQFPAPFAHRYGDSHHHTVADSHALTGTNADPNSPAGAHFETGSNA